VLQLISGGRSYRGTGSLQQTAWLFPGHPPALQPLAYYAGAFGWADSSTTTERGPMMT
jgi:hypothetical protein